ncbi:hypothetical protein BU14_2698s0001 [Porphyra umbilicalis]|uniref:Uncharacterized protein n=1 Tax=Porphyra umbilicalis TaxID=2786 RepID=A0A1X6NJG4_PORUM|nr:hypothetical protein BU14_2698s0001 [Porphyra umbilicalis]|eukprot:OSX68493.1 hypothetical protein BU14_2698s0001 [Porphyra umbilicalis]
MTHSSAVVRTTQPWPRPYGKSHRSSTQSNASMHETFASRPPPRARRPHQSSSSPAGSSRATTRAAAGAPSTSSVTNGAGMGAW